MVIRPDQEQWLQGLVAKGAGDGKKAELQLWYIYIYVANYTLFYFAYYFPEKMRGVFLDYLDIFFISSNLDHGRRHITSSSQENL